MDQTVYVSRLFVSKFCKWHWHGTSSVLFSKIDAKIEKIHFFPLSLNVKY